MRLCCIRDHSKLEDETAGYDDTNDPDTYENDDNNLTLDESERIKLEIAHEYLYRKLYKFPPYVRYIAFVISFLWILGISIIVLALALQ